MKKYSSCAIKVLFVCTTWTIILYLYLRITYLTNQHEDHVRSHSIEPNRKAPFEFYDKLDSKRVPKKYNSLDNEAVLPYETGEKSVIFNKHKYFKNSAKLIKQLQPKELPPSELIGMVRTPEDQKLRDEGYKVHAFNVLVSQRLGYHRDLPDTRHKL